MLSDCFEVICDSPDSLYIGDLNTSVTAAQLYDTFSQFGQVTSVQLCRHPITKLSLGHAHVNYYILQDAKAAIELLNFELINGEPIIVMFSKSPRPINGRTILFITNLDRVSFINSQLLREIFSRYGTIISTKVVADSNRKSLGFGFVHFEEEEAAERASQLHLASLNGREISVDFYVHKQERDLIKECRKHNTVYFQNMSKRGGYLHSICNYTNHFFGEVVDTYYPEDVAADYCFVVFKKHEDAAKVVECLNGDYIDGQKLYVAWAHGKSVQGANLYVKNLDDIVDDQRLKELFSEFGTITSSKVMLDSQGRGSGFVAFSTPENATKAVKEMNGKMIGQKPLHVAVAEFKGEREAKMEARFGKVLAKPSQVEAAVQASGTTGYPGLDPPQPAGCGYKQQFQSQGQAAHLVAVKQGETPEVHEILETLRMHVYPLVEHCKNLLVRVLINCWRWT